MDITQDNLAKLNQLFPNLVKEGEIDMHELKAIFGQEPAIAEERYGLSWGGTDHPHPAARPGKQPPFFCPRTCA